MRALAFVLVAVALGAAASTAAAAETAEDCSQIEGTTHDRDSCFRRVYEKTDAAMTALYRQLLDSLADAGERSLLQDAEQAWERYRDKQCDFETAGTRAGTIHPIVVSDCLTEKTKAHIEELRRQLDCGDGDTGCLHERRQ
jgi:uncharacterized protein YecT (DUF1311 family)